MQPPRLPPPGWYPDPAGGVQQRYWDGAGWSAHVRPVPAVRRRPHVWVIVGVAVVGLCVGLCALVASQLGKGPTRHNLPAMHTRAWAKIDHMIRALEYRSRYRNDERSCGSQVLPSGMYRTPQPCYSLLLRRLSARDQ